MRERTGSLIDAMLALDDSRWKELRHAYGSAEDVPGLLEELYSHPLKSTWGEIWSLLCHQYTVYTATFAAVPHILVAARTHPLGSRFDFIIFLGMVTACEDGSRILQEFRTEYEAARSEAADMALAELAARPDTREAAVYLLQSLAGLCNCTPLGRKLEGFATEEFPIKCKSCRAQLYIWPSEGCYRIYAEDPTSQPSTPSTIVTRSPHVTEAAHVTRDQVRLDNASEWISSLAVQAGYPDVAERSAQLFGVGVCPACHATFSVRDEIVSQAP